ncbi:MAG: aminoacetone oxidase family FAD-binding enzyme [bacterium]|nr:aminoacetone oxidase family FAD-binding enzyme [bacterium]
MKKYDLAIIGGGPAGMMAASRAEDRGLSVILLEKNNELGKKLLITGGGRCNITNAEFEVRAFLAKLGKSGNFLFSTFAKFGVQDTFDFFAKRGLKIKVEELKRAFPDDEKSSSVLQIFTSRLKKTEIRTNSPVAGFLKNGNKIAAVKLGNGETVTAGNYILAVGGSSHPETGSAGDGYSWLKEIGHTVVIPEPSLVPIAIKDKWVKDLKGITLDSIKLSAYQNSKKILSKKGRVLFTHFGISGPTVINMSRDIGELLKWGPVAIQIDLFPSLDYGMMNAKLQDLFDSNKNKIFKNCMLGLVPSGMINTICELAKIDPVTPVHSVTREDRLRLVEMLKHLQMSVDHLLGPDKSIVTSGGVACEEVDFKTMRSRLFSNLLFAGDILNIERPSGGYSLQICWSTGWVAGSVV